MSTVPAAGLTSAEVAERVLRGEINRTRSSALRDYATIAYRHLVTVFNLVVVPTALMLFHFGEWRAAISVTGTVLANTLIGLYQEVRAKFQLDSLAILTARKARVIRDGTVQEINADEVVLGDLILLRAGDTVVADGVVTDAQYLEVDEALLTGESDPVRRKPGERLLSGSICVTGEASYRAEKVGAKAFAQSVTTDARRYSYTTSPLTRALNRIITWLSVTALVLCGVYALLEVLHVITAQRMFLMIAATVISMIPQGLVLTATISFTIGAVVIGRRGALVQRLNAVEAMAAVDVICTDKTGTLTTNQLRLSELRTLDAQVNEADVRHRLALLATATIDRDNKNVVAIRTAVGVELAEVVDQLPFNARTRFSAVRVRDGGTERVLVLGAPEVIAPDLGPWADDLARMRSAGLRVLLFAEVCDELAALEPGRVPAPLCTLAILALADELRPDAADVLKALYDQGIALKAISGDNPQTVGATISPLNLPISHEPVVTGKELESAADPVEFVRTHCVFGRVEPVQKVAIVDALQKGGANVAMIGDGVNDVLPIKKADLGIAMGEGSAAAKSVSSLVLQNNNFAVLPEAIAEGRTIVRNLRRAAKLFLTKNVYSFVYILAYAVGLFDIPFPYLPQQVSLLNWMVIGVPALLIALSRERSRAPDKTPFLEEVGGFALRTGLLFALAGLTLLALSKHVWHDDEKTQRTMLLTMLIFLGMTVLWRVIGGDGMQLNVDHKLRRLSLIRLVAQ
ncbi:MAG: HAD-IC family P-type ATPase [Planctomycetes bacterium]|nr:HAD-IC family P-type ATPase [Planctomycetota bacterium]